MKKILAFLLLAFIFQASFCFGQEYPNSIWAGIGLSHIKGGESWKGKLGFQIGIESKILELDQRSLLTAGLNFSLQGADYSESGSYGNFAGTVNLTYIGIPVLYTHNFSDKLYGEAGLQPGILMSAKDKYDGHTDDYKDYMKKFDLGLPVGVCYRLTDRLSVGLRVIYGLTNLDDSDDDGNDHNLLVLGLIKYNFDWPKSK